MVDFICGYLFSQRITGFFEKYSKSVLARISMILVLTGALFFLSSQTYQLLGLALITSLYINFFTVDVWVNRDYSILSRHICEAYQLDVSSNLSKVIFFTEHFIASVLLILIIVCH
jgi:hypothetical protein